MSHQHQEHPAEPSSLGPVLLVVTAILAGIGLIAIYAASAMKGAEQFHDPYLFVKRQGLVALVGFGSIAVIRAFPIQWFEKMAFPLLVLALLLLAAIFIPGAYTKVGGASRWLGSGGLRFQTSEIAKVALIFFLAKNLSRKKSNVQSMGWSLGSNVVVFALIAFLMMMQPDFGSTVLMASITFLMLYLAGLPRKYIVSAIAGGILAGAAAILAAPYRMKRLFSFIDPWAEINNGGFQIIQSYLGFRNGGLLGVGLGESRQKLFFLPEAHTDFILSVIGEEMGVLGVLLVCILFFLLTWIGFQIAERQKSTFLSLLAYGFTSLIALQGVLNMGVVMGLLPTKGIPLPFISNGASSLIVFLCVIGILYRLDAESGSRKSDHVFN